MSDAVARLQAEAVARAPTDPSTSFDLQLAGTRVPVLSGRVTRAVDQVAHAFAAEVAWTPGADPAFDKLVLPYSYTPAVVTLDGERVLTGRLYRTAPRKNADGVVLTLEGASLTADLVDSSVPAEPWHDQWEPCESVWNFAPTLVGPLGIAVVTDINQSHHPQSVVRFDRVQLTPGETYAELLTRLAFARGMLVTTNRDGALVITIAHVGGNYVPKGEWADGFTPGFPVAILREGMSPVLDWGADYDGRKRWGKYTAHADDDLGLTISGSATDAGVPATRTLRFNAGNENTAGNIAGVVEWRRATVMADAMTLRLPVRGWMPEHSSRLWTQNTLVTVEAPSLFLGQATTMLLRQVEHVLGGDGKTTVLSLVPPETYSGQAIATRWATKTTAPTVFEPGSIES